MDRGALSKSPSPSFKGEGVGRETIDHPRKRPDLDYSTFCKGKFNRGYPFPLDKEK
ncbi:hypothetical protein ES706_06591 [subsurface metagenome]